MARQTDRLHGPKPEGLGSPLRHFFDGKTALEVWHFVELMARHVLLARDERRDERLVLFSRERRVPVIVAPALAVARGFEKTAVLERIGGDDGGDGIVERQRLHAEAARDRGGKGIRGEWTRRDDAGTGKLHDFTPNEGDVPMSQNPSLQRLRKRDSIDGECAPARDPRLVRRLQYDAAPPAPQQAHLGLEQAVCVRGFDRFECVAADQLGEALRLMRRCHLDRSHFAQRYMYSPLGEGPGGFTARKATTDHVYDATSSASGAVSSTVIVCPHLRHLRVVSPVVLDLISSIPTNPQLGQGTSTGLFQVE